MSRILKITMMLCCGVLLLGMSGCATAQVAQDTIAGPQIDTVLASVDTMPPLASGYQWLSHRGKADIVDTGGTRTCNFFFVNRVDSIIYLNVSADGIEVMRAVLTPDSIKYVNKLTYQYYAGTYAPLRLLLKRPVNLGAMVCTGMPSAAISLRI